MWGARQTMHFHASGWNPVHDTGLAFAVPVAFFSSLNIAKDT
jgi:hypothetical protein